MAVLVPLDTSSVNSYVAPPVQPLVVSGTNARIDCVASTGASSQRGALLVVASERMLPHRRHGSHLAALVALQHRSLVGATQQNPMNYYCLGWVRTQYTHTHK